MSPVSGKDFYDLSGPDLLAYCGADASKWAQAFCRIKEAQGWSADDIDEGLMITWFANAIEHSSQVRDHAPTSQQWQPIETAPHDTLVLIGYWYRDEWVSEVAKATSGWRRNGVSTMSAHGQATFWQPLPAAPALSDTSTVWTEQDLAEAKAEAKELSDYFNPPDSSPAREGE